MKNIIKKSVPCKSCRKKHTVTFQDGKGSYTCSFCGLKQTHYLKPKNTKQ